MTKKTKGRYGWHRATQKTSNNRNSNAIRSRLKAVIVNLALWGLIPAGLATWLIQRGGMRDA